jgi:hypothetical protein
MTNNTACNNDCPDLEHAVSNGKNNKTAEMHKKYKSDGNQHIWRFVIASSSSMAVEESDGSHLFDFELKK